MQTFHRLTLKIIYMYINIYMYTNGQNPLMYHYLKPTAVILWVWGKYNVHAANLWSFKAPPPLRKKKKKRKKDLSRQKSEYDSFFPNYRVHQNKCWLETVLKFLIHLVISLCVYGSDLYIPGIQLIVHVFHGSCLLKLLVFFLLSCNIVLRIILFN